MGIKVDVSGWRIDGIGYTFPSGTIIDPGDYLVIAKNPGAGQLGPFSGNLSNSGERLRLINQSERLMDELDYGDDGRWPAAADGSGATLAKRNPYTANKPPEHWDDSAQLGGTPGAINFPDDNIPPPTSTVALLALADNWRYNESGVDLGADLGESGHAVGAGLGIGPGGIGFESWHQHPNQYPARVPRHSAGAITYYFEREFELTASQFASLESLKMRHGFDDGADRLHQWRRGLPREHARRPDQRQPPRPPPAWRSTNSQPTLPISSGAVTSGTNRISVEVHQENPVVATSCSGWSSTPRSPAPSRVRHRRSRSTKSRPPPSQDFWVELDQLGPGRSRIGRHDISAAADPTPRVLAAAQAQLAPGGLMSIDEASLGFRPADGEKLILYDAVGHRGARCPSGHRPIARTQRRRMALPVGRHPWGDQHVRIQRCDRHQRDRLQPARAGSRSSRPSDLPADAARLDGRQLALQPSRRGSAIRLGRERTPARRKLGTGAGADRSQRPAPCQSRSRPSGHQIEYRRRRSPITSKPTSTSPQTISPTSSSLKITHQIDDGAVFYINGVEVDRFGMPDGSRRIRDSRVTWCRQCRSHHHGRAQLQPARRGLEPPLRRSAPELARVAVT